METRTITVNGSEVLTISLPNGTSEERWQEVISGFQLEPGDVEVSVADPEPDA